MYGVVTRAESASNGVAHTDTNNGTSCLQMQVADEGRSKGEGKWPVKQSNCSSTARARSPRVAVAGPHEVLRDVLVRAEVITEGQEEELLVFVSEWDEALD